MAFIKLEKYILVVYSERIFIPGASSLLGKIDQI